MHFYGKSIRIKISLLHQVLQNSCPKIRARYNFWPKSCFFNEKFIFFISFFHIESEIYFKFYVLIYDVIQRVHH